MSETKISRPRVYDHGWFMLQELIILLPAREYHNNVVHSLLLVFFLPHLYKNSFGSGQLNATKPAFFLSCFSFSSWAVFWGDGSAPDTGSYGPLLQVQKVHEYVHANRCYRITVHYCSKQNSFTGCCDHYTRVINTSYDPFTMVKIDV